LVSDSRSTFGSKGSKTDVPREQELTDQRAQDEALQAYLDQMSTLMLERDLRHAEVGDEIQTVARARTLTALGRLDPSRKRALMQFITEAGLVQGSINEKALTSRSTGRKEAFEGVPVISLSGADLSGTDLREIGGFGGTIGGKVGGPAYYSAGGGSTYLNGADLSSADLSGANLRWASLFNANLRNANLSSVNLSGAEDVTDEQLTSCKSLRGSTMPDGQTLRGPKTPKGPTFEDWLESVGGGWGA
jgi:uncharacterized protein YjbI with pentapeptide repeats